MPYIRRLVKWVSSAGIEDPKPFVWTKTADQILASIARYAQRTTAAQFF